MLHKLSSLYENIVLKKPVLTIIFSLIITAYFATQATEFKMDASADSLILENDQALKYYRSIKARYGSDDFLIITYTPKADLFSKKNFKWSDATQKQIKIPGSRR